MNSNFLLNKNQISSQRKSIDIDLQLQGYIQNLRTYLNEMEKRYLEAAKKK